MQWMSSKPSNPAQAARLEKQKIASTEGAKALADYEAGAVAVRKNMERLRALRLAKEAEEAARAPAVTAAPKKKAASKGAKESSKPKAATPLSEWLASQRDSGRSN